MQSYETKRQELVSLVLQNMSKQPAGSRSVNKGVKNLTLTHEERILRSAYRSSTRYQSPLQKSNIGGTLGNSLSNRQNPLTNQSFNGHQIPQDLAAKAYDNLPSLTSSAARNQSRSGGSRRKGNSSEPMTLFHNSLTVGNDQSKQGRDMKRWELVLNKKNAVSETKQK